MLDIVLGDKAKEAKCYNHPDPDWFFIPSNNLYAQKKFCIGCKIIDECLDYAIRNDVSGVWGGTTTRERKRKIEHMDDYNMSLFLILYH